MVLNTAHLMAINWGGTTSEQTWSWQVILTLMTWTEGAQGWGTQQGWYIRPQVKLADGYVMLSSCLSSIWHGSRRCSHFLEGQVQSNAKTTDDKSFFFEVTSFYTWILYVFVCRYLTSPSVEVKKQAPLEDVGRSKRPQLLMLFMRVPFVRVQR